MSKCEWCLKSYYMARKLSDFFSVSQNLVRALHLIVEKLVDII